MIQDHDHRLVAVRPQDSGALHVDARLLFVTPSGRLSDSESSIRDLLHQSADLYTVEINRSELKPNQLSLSHKAARAMREPETIYKIFKVLGGVIHELERTSQPATRRPNRLRPRTARRRLDRVGRSQRSNRPALRQADASAPRPTQAGNRVHHRRLRTKRPAPYDRPGATTKPPGRDDAVVQPLPGMVHHPPCQQRHCGHGLATRRRQDHPAQRRRAFHGLLRHQSNRRHFPKAARVRRQPIRPQRRQSQT